MYTMLSGQIMNNLAIRFGLPPLCACILPTPAQRMSRVSLARATWMPVVY